MPDLTKPFGKVFDALRLVSQPIRNTTAVPLRLYGDAGELIATVTTGWFTDELSPEQVGERVTELHVTDREGVAFTEAVFFGWGGYKHERTRFPNPPVNNPREWIWSVKPIGLDVGGIGAFDLVDDAGTLIIDDIGMQIVGT